MDSFAVPLQRFPPLYRLRWTLRFDQSFDAPRYLGSALRGLLGHGLRRTACVTRLKTCRDCSLVESCVYTELFEPTARSTGWARAPYVLRVPVTGGRRYAAGEPLVFEMTLLGPRQHHLPYLLQAFQVGGRLGLGPKEVGYEVAELAALGTLGSDDWRVLYAGGEALGTAEAAMMRPPPAPQAIRLTWETPWRFKRAGDFVGPDQFSAGLLLEGLLHRFFELLGERPSRPMLHRALEPSLDVDARLEWQDWSRYSSRQKTRMQVGGLMGRIDLAGRDLSSWSPLLWLGQWLHLGKFTSMGLGRYRLSTAGLPDSRASDDSGIICRDGMAQERATDKAGMPPN